MGTILKRVISCPFVNDTRLPEPWGQVKSFFDDSNAQYLLGVLESDDFGRYDITSSLKCFLTDVADTIRALHPDRPLEIVAVSQFPGVREVVSGMTGDAGTFPFVSFACLSSIRQWHEDKNAQFYCITLTNDASLTTEVVTSSIMKSAELGISRMFKEGEISSIRLQRNVLHKMPFTSFESDRHNFHRTPVEATSSRGGHRQLHFAFRVVPDDDEGVTDVDIASEDYGYETSEFYKSEFGFVNFGSDGLDEEPVSF